MIVVDTSVWIDYFRNVPSDGVRKLRAIDKPSEILIGDVVLLEILRGARDADHAERMERSLRQFAMATMLSIPLSVRAAAFYRKLRGRGITVHKTADLIIATFCVDHDYRLLHNDRDYEPFIRHCALRPF